MGISGKKRSLKFRSSARFLILLGLWSWLDAGELPGSSISPSFVGAWPDYPSGTPLDLAYGNDLVYLATSTAGLQIISLTDPSSPRRLGQLSLFGAVSHIAIGTSHAYVTDDLGLHSVRISNPSTLSWTSYLPVSGEVHDLAWHEHLLGVSTSQGLLIVDVSLPDQLKILGNLPLTISTGNSHLALTDELALLSVPGDGLHIINLEKPETPLGTQVMAAPSGEAYDVTISGTTAYWCVGTNGLMIVDISDPTAPNSFGPYQPPGSSPTTSYEEASAVDGQVFVSSPSDHIHSLDLSDPSDPVWSPAMVSVSLRRMVVTPHYLLGLQAENQQFNGLIIFSRPAEPASSLDFLSRLPTTYAFSHVALSGNLACVIDEPNGLHLLDLQSPNIPTRLSTIPVTNIESILTIRDTLYAKEKGQGNLHVWDISQPTQPQKIRIDLTHNVELLMKLNNPPKIVAIQQVTPDEYALVNLSQPDAPVPLSYFHHPYEILDATMEGELLALISRTESLDLELGIYQLEETNAWNLQSTQKLIESPPPSSSSEIAMDLDDQKLHLIGPWGFDTFNLSNPRSPQHWHQDQLFQANHLDVNHPIAFIPDKVLGIHRVDVSAPGALSVDWIYSLGYQGNPHAALGVSGNTLVAVYGDQGLIVLESRGDEGEPPQILLHPENQHLADSEDIATFQVEATGTLPLFYDWQINGLSIGNHSSRFSITNSPGMSPSVITVVVSNEYGLATSSATTLTVNQPPTVSWLEPSPYQVVNPSESISLRVAAADQDGAVSEVVLYEGSNWLASITSPPYRFDWQIASNGMSNLGARARDNEGAWSSPQWITLLATNQPMWQLNRPAYLVNESNQILNITVQRNQSGSSSVRLRTLDGSARAISANGLGQYEAIDVWLVFGEEERKRELSIALTDDSVFRNHPWFVLRLESPEDPWKLAYPHEAIVTIEDDDPPWTTNAVVDLIPPAPPPASRGSLRITLEPESASGKWRFSWERSWRESGQAATNLVPGNYPVEFLPVAGYEAPGPTSYSVTPDLEEIGFHEYALRLPPRYGSLQATIFPSSIASASEIHERGQWRLESDSGDTWFDHNSIRPGLGVGRHLVVWKPVPGFDTPPAREIQIVEDQVTHVEGRYLLTPVSTAENPEPLESFTDLAQSIDQGRPDAFCGQIITENGTGSGFVVKRRTVLTAAHVVFDESTLTFKDNVQWFFQKHRGEHESPPQIPRGWFVFSGYAAQRTRDRLVDNLPPGEMSTTSRSLDVAALYFFEDAGRGGYGGYRITDTETRDWLLEPSKKLILGYPIRGVPLEQKGILHAAGPDFFVFEKVTASLYRSFNVLSLPGMSGGIVFEKEHSWSKKHFYPVAVIIGGSQETVSRVIDLDTVEIINKAEITSRSYKKATQHGLISIVNPASEDSTNDTRFKIIIKPDRARSEGASWRFTTETNFTVNPELPRQLPSSEEEILIQMKPLPGWGLPINQTVQLVAGQTTSIEVHYIFRPLSLTHDRGLELSGGVGESFTVEYRDGLRNTFPWQLLDTVTLTNSTQALIFPWSHEPLRDNPRRFYRVRPPDLYP